jgi:MOSC domain-containing protein YiiM
MRETNEVRAVANSGLEGCAHVRPGGKRQVLLMDHETLDALGLAAGILRENITTEGLPVNELDPGEKLRIGKTLLEVTMSCTPCAQMEKIRGGLRQELRGRRGVLCRVLRGGTLRQGDEIEKFSS